MLKISETDAESIYRGSIQSERELYYTASLKTRPSRMSSAIHDQDTTLIVVCKNENG